MGDDIVFQPVRRAILALHDGDRASRPIRRRWAGVLAKSPKYVFNRERDRPIWEGVEDACVYRDIFPCVPCVLQFHSESADVVIGVFGDKSAMQFLYGRADQVAWARAPSLHDELAFGLDDAASDVVADALRGDAVMASTLMASTPWIVLPMRQRRSCRVGQHHLRPHLYSHFVPVSPAVRAMYDQLTDAANVAQLVEQHAELGRRQAQSERDYQYGRIDFETHQAALEALLGEYRQARRQYDLMAALQKIDPLHGKL